MKVIHVSHYYAEFKGSFINQIETLADKILENGDNIVFLFPNEAKDLKWCQQLSKKYKIYFLSNINRNTEKQVIKELREILKKENPDIIHSHFDGYDLAITKAADDEVIKIYHRHNEFDASNLPIYKKLYAMASLKTKMNYIKNKGYNVFPSSEILSKFAKLGYVKTDNSRVIENGISTKRLDKVYNAKKCDKPVIFSLLRNWELKGGDILFKAVEKINEKEIKVYLSSIIKSEEIKANAGYVPEWFISLEVTDDIKEYYEKADIFVSSSRKETFSYALAEAIYCKLACISSDIDGVQWSKKIPTVKFFKNESIDELESKIYESLDKKYSDEAYETSKAIIRNQYSEYTWSSNVIKMYSELIG